MSNFEKQLIDQIESILNDYEKQEVPSSGGLSGKGERVVQSFITRCFSAIERVGGKTSPYYIRAKEMMETSSRYIESIKLSRLIGILEGLLNDLRGGYLSSYTEIVHADIFADYLEMASYLLEEGYKDPAAVIAGSTLEEHLRKLCLKHNIEVEIIKNDKYYHKKASVMNVGLVKAKVYSKLDQKNVTAWLDLRNKAAHGQYEQYNNQQVELLIKGIREFLARIPA